MALYLQVTHPYTSRTYVTNISRGGTYVVIDTPSGFDCPDVAVRRRAKIAAYQKQGLGATSREITTESLNVLGLDYMAEVERGCRLAGKIARFEPVIHHSLAVIHQTNGFGVDMPFMVSCMPRDGVNSKFSSNLRLLTALGSAMEHGVIEQNYPLNHAVSTVSYVRQNNAAGNKTYYATQSNYYSDIYNDSDFASGWPQFHRDYEFPSLLFPSSGNPWDLVIPQSGQINVDQLTSSGYFKCQNSSVGAIILPDNYAANGGYSTTEGWVDPSQKPNAPDGTPGPESQENDEKADPIDMLTGAYVSDQMDMTLGSGGARGLTLSRHYSSLLSNTAGDLGYGWNLNLHSVLTETPNTWLGLGGGTVQQSAAAIAAIYAINDLLATNYQSAKKWVVASIASGWLVDGMRTNTVTALVNRKNFTFSQLPDGSYVSGPGITARLVKDSQTGCFSIQERFGRTTLFDSQKRISSFVDADGKALSFAYDSQTGKLQAVSDCYGRAFTLNYFTSGSNQGLLHTVVDSTGRTVTYSYSNGLLQSVTDPENQTAQFTYDGSGRLWQAYNETGQQVVENTYDDQGRITQQIAEGDPNQAWTYSINGRWNVETTPGGNTSVFVYDDKGRKTGEIDGAGNLTRYYFDAQDHVVQITDPRGKATIFQYDGANNLQFVTNANNHQSEFRYDDAFRVVKSIDPAGKETSFEYDERHHLKKITDPVGRIMLYSYYTSGAQAGLLESITEPGGDVTQFQYDAFGFPSQTSRADGSVVSSGFNALGDLLTTQITAQGDPNSHALSVAYDKRRLPLAATDSLGFGIANGYDARGRLVSQSDRYGNVVGTSISPWGRTLSSTAASGATTLHHYDLSGRRDRTTNALGQTTQFGYDPASRLQSATDPLSQSTTNGYDASSNLQTLTNPRGKSYSWTYTALNQVETLTTPLSRPATHGYDGRDLLASIQKPSGNTTALTYFDDKRLHQSADSLGTIDYGYDPKGRLYTVTEGTRVIKREYDALNRLRKFTDGAGNVIQYQYDGAGNLTVLSYPDGKTVTYSYDAADRLQTVTDWANRVTQFGYDSRSRLSTVSLPNGTARTYGYDNAGRVSLIQDSGTGGIISRFALQYDPLDRIAKETVTSEPAPFAVVPASMNYDDDDRIATWNGQSCASDLDGNLTTGPLGGPLAAFAFDARNRLTGVGNTTYTYDAENRRVAQTIDGITTSYVNDPQGALSRLLVQSNALSGTTRYVYANGLLLYAEAASGLQVHHYDYRGSTVAITDGIGTVTDRIVYGDYGEIVSSTGATPTPFLYNGAYGVQTDSNGLCFMRARYYSPETRRFLNADPIGFGGGMNWYGYVGGNPVNAVDSLGLDVEFLVGGPYSSHSYGHAALRVFGNGYDQTYDYGRYGQIWGTGGSQGEGMMRVWSDFGKYISGENATGRTTTGYRFPTTPAQDAAVISYYAAMLAGKAPNLDRGFMQQFRIEDYDALNRNCTTMSSGGLKTALPGLDFSNTSFNQGRGLSGLEKAAASLSGWPTKLFMPLDAKAYLDSLTGVQAPTSIRSYKQ